MPGSRRGRDRGAPHRPGAQALGEHVGPARRGRARWRRTCWVDLQVERRRSAGRGCREQVVLPRPLALIAPPRGRSIRITSAPRSASSVIPRAARGRSPAISTTLTPAQRPGALSECVVMARDHDSTAVTMRGAARTGDGGPGRRNTARIRDHLLSQRPDQPFFTRSRNGRRVGPMPSGTRVEQTIRGREPAGDPLPGRGAGRRARAPARRHRLAHLRASAQTSAGLAPGGLRRAAGADPAGPRPPHPAVGLGRELRVAAGATTTTTGRRSCGVDRRRRLRRRGPPCLTPSDGHGFTIDEAEVVFRGCCPACSSMQRRATESPRSRPPIGRNTHA